MLAIIGPFRNTDRERRHNWPQFYPDQREIRQITVEIRWDEKAGLRRDAIRSQVIGALEAQEIKETGDEED